MPIHMSNHAQGPSTVSRQYLHVAAAILRGVDAGQFRPGEFLPSDRQLAESMGVSRPTLREALVALEVAGIVSSSRGAGVRVSPHRHTAVPVDDHDLLARPREIIEARCYWEPAVVPLVVDRMTQSELDRLSEMTEQYEREACAEHLTGDFAKMGLRFHIALADMTGNTILSHAVASLASYEEHPLWVLLNESAMRSPHARKEQAGEHAAIVMALQDRAPARAQRLLHQHLVRLRAQILGPALARDGSVSALQPV